MNPANKRTVSAVLIALAIGYAVLRYHVIKGVPWSNFPLFILNKGLSLSAVFLIAVSYVLGHLSRFFPKTFIPWLSMRKYLGLFGFGLAAVHALMSLLLLSPAYYPKFFVESGKLNLVGELSLLFGVVSFSVFSIVAITSIPSVEKEMDKNKWLKVQRMGYLAFASVGLHVLIMGFAGWLTPKTWPGGLLPVSLVAFIVIAITILLKMVALMLPKTSAPSR